MLVLGIDTTLVAGLVAGLVSEEPPAALLALSPNSAFRGLVPPTAVGTAGGAAVSAGRPLANLAGLGWWWLGGLAVAVWRIWPAVDD